MSQLERLPGFPPGGSPSWPLSQPPCWRGYAGAAAAMAWWQPGAGLALDFANGRYMREEETASLTAVLSVSRASAATGFAADGAVQSFGANEPIILAGRGLVPSGQFTNLYNPASPATGFGWAKQNGAAPYADGVFSRVDDASDTLAPQLLGAEIIPADASVWTFWFDVKKEAATSIGRFLCRLIGGTAIARQITFNAETGAYKADHVGFTGGTVPAAAVDLGDRWRFAVTIKNNGTNNSAQTYWTPALNNDLNSASPDLTAMGTGTFAWPHLINGPYLGDSLRLPDTVPLLASDISIPDFGDLATAFDFVNGFGGRIVADIDRLGEDRFLFAAGTGATDYVGVRLFSPGDQMRLLVRVSDIFVVNAVVPITATGRLEIEFRIKSGDCHLSVQSVGEVSDTTAFIMPALSSALVGSGFVTGKYLNSPLRELQLWRAVTCH